MQAVLIRQLTVGEEVRETSREAEERHLPVMGLPLRVFGA